MQRRRGVSKTTRTKLLTRAALSLMLHVTRAHHYYVTVMYLLTMTEWPVPSPSSGILYLTPKSKSNIGGGRDTAVHMAVGHMTAAAVGHA